MARETGEANPKVATINLSRPEKLQNVLREDMMKDDCLSCRLTGATALIGLGAYSYFSSKHQLQLREAAIKRSASKFGMRSRHAGISGIALSFVGMGLWRLVN
ncbi:hypothetical protein MMC29_002893 [Sticta canariensis]|nr:hypothetical protein [Sticta canariensis]